MDKTEQNIHTTTSGMAASSQQTIDLKAMWNKLWENRKLFFWALPITFVVSCALILCVPRYYECTVVLAPESQNAGSNLSSLVSSFGFDIASATSGDAIYPMVYPDVVSSPDFLITLFDTPVKTIHSEFSGTFYDYLNTQIKYPFWVKIKKAIKHAVIFWADKSGGGDPSAQPGEINAFWLNKRQRETITQMRECITCMVDKKTNIIQITIQTQDPLVCATIAQALGNQIQCFMRDYRTQKAQTDIEYYNDLIAQAKVNYEIASEQYISYIDSHTGLNLQQYKVEANNLQGEMDMKYAAYTSLQKQLIAAQAKLQENTPVFTTIQSASVPDKAAGPHRSIFVLGMCFVVFCGIAFWEVKDLLNLGF